MGRENILKKIKGKFVVTVVAGVLITLFAAFLIFCLALEGDVNIGLYIIILVLAGLGIFVVAIGTRAIANPMNTPQLKTNPRLLEMADELFSDVKFEDKLIILSDRIIAGKRDLTQMAYFSEVLLIYEYTHTTNMITDTHKIKLETADYTAMIDVYACSEEVISGLINSLHRFCPNAVTCGSQEELNSRIHAIEQERRERKKKGY